MAVGEQNNPTQITLGCAGPYGCDVGFGSKPEPKRRKPKPIGLDWRLEAGDRYGCDYLHLSNSAGPEFDELVIDNWFHLERMGGKQQAYFLRIGDAEINVCFDRSGKPTVRINDVTAEDLQKQVAQLEADLAQAQRELTTLQAGLRGAF